MAVPGRREAAAFLLDLRPPDWFVAHVAAVAEIAAFLARRLTQRGVALERDRVEAAALLHDVDKLLWTPRERPGPHGEAGGRWLAEHGFAELRRPVAGHPVSLLSDDARYERWRRDADGETRIVAYADKRAEQRLLPMAARFATWRTRHPDRSADLDRAWERALQLEASICAEAGLEPAEVRRLPWVRRALHAAKRR